LLLVVNDDDDLDKLKDELENNFLRKIRASDSAQQKLGWFVSYFFYHAGTRKKKQVTRQVRIRIFLR
jgi:hypothetical protein